PKPRLQQKRPNRRVKQKQRPMRRRGQAPPHRKRPRRRERNDAKMSADDLLDQFKEMTLLELNEFVKKFEEAFDVQAAAPMAMGAMPTAAGAPAAGAEEAEEQTEFDVVLSGAGDKKI